MLLPILVNAKVRERFECRRAGWAGSCSAWSGVDSALNLQYCTNETMTHSMQADRRACCFGYIIRTTNFTPSLQTLHYLPSVCMKVMQDVRDAMPKEDQKDKPKIEQAIGAHCKKDTLSARERKICYYIDPIKRDVAQPFSLGMTVEKVCKRIDKTNPEICSVKFPVKTENLEKKDLTKLRVKQLKSILLDRGVECKGCVEKEEFIARVQETEHLAGSDEF